MQKIEKENIMWPCFNDIIIITKPNLNLEILRLLKYVQSFMYLLTDSSSKTQKNMPLTPLGFKPMLSNKYDDSESEF